MFCASQVADNQTLLLYVLPNLLSNFAIIFGIYIPVIGPQMWTEFNRAMVGLVNSQSRLFQEVGF